MSLFSNLVGASMRLKIYLAVFVVSFLCISAAACQDLQSLPSALRAAGEESLNCLHKCDGFFCEFQIFQGKLTVDKVSPEDQLGKFSLGDMQIESSCLGHYWKIGEKGKYVVDNVESSVTPKKIGKKIFVSGEQERKILYDEQFFLSCNKNVAQVFRKEGHSVGLEITPLTLGVLGHGNFLGPGLSIRWAGKHVVVDEIEFEDDYVKFRSKPVLRPDMAAAITYTLDANHSMSPSKVVLDAPQAFGVATVREFKRFRDAWFPSYTTYAQVDKGKDSASVIVMKVQKLSEFQDASELSVMLNKGMILNDDIAGHVQLKVQRDRSVGIDDLSDLNIELSVKESENTAPASTSAENSNSLGWILLAAALCGCMVLLVSFLIQCKSSEMTGT